MRVLALATLAGLALTGPSLAAPAAPGLSSQAAHGAAIAQRCAACHAVGATDRSRNSGAPPFRVLARRSNILSLEASLKRISKGGHFEMRPTELSEADSQDIAAYIATLDKPAR